MKAVVLGAGKMGRAICWALDQLELDVTAIDISSSALSEVSEIVPNAKTETVEDIGQIFSKIKSADIVVSSLPYHQNEKIGIWCVDNGIRYCDLGGRIDVSNTINEHANKLGKGLVFTDLGLAPGWVNILAEQGYKELDCEKVDSVEMMVGGLPGIQSTPPLNYLNTWSVDGLINEYKDHCKVLVGGDILTVQGMEGLTKVHSHILEQDLEAFYTSGGASHTIPQMKERGVKDCSYKTLRYEGHCEVVKLLIRTCGLSNETLKQIFENASKAQMQGDIVIVKVIVASGPFKWEREYMVPHDETFSAMQMATAFPISSVAALMADGTFDGVGHSLNYADIPMEYFNANLSKICDFGRFRYPFY